MTLLAGLDAWILSPGLLVALALLGVLALVGRLVAGDREVAAVAVAVECLRAARLK